MAIQNYSKIYFLPHLQYYDTQKFLLKSHYSDKNIIQREFPEIFYDFNKKAYVCDNSIKDKITSFIEKRRKDIHLKNMQKDLLRLNIDLKKYECLYEKSNDKYLVNIINNYKNKINTIEKNMGA